MNSDGFICGCLVYICIILSYFGILLEKIITRMERKRRNEQEKI